MLDCRPAMVRAQGESVSEVQRARGTATRRTRAEDPQATLLARVARGDRAAFTDLYHATSDRLLGIAVKMLGRRDIAEEVLQEAFLAVWLKAASYRPSLGAPMAWMTTIVRHRAIDRLRLMGGAQALPVGSDGELEDLRDVAVGAADSQIIARKAILDCLDRLKEKQRRLILLAFYYGYTHEELSARSGTPLGTIKSDVRRGLADLKGCLDG